MLQPVAVAAGRMVLFGVRRSTIRRRAGHTRPLRPRRPGVRTWPFQGQNTGSNPVGDAIQTATGSDARGAGVPPFGPSGQPASSDWPHAPLGAEVAVRIEGLLGCTGLGPDDVPGKQEHVE